MGKKGRVYLNCPKCGSLLKRFYMREGEKKQFKPNGFTCKECKMTVFD